ncbi:MAG TPA: type II secretion system F family protein [Anaerolineales bacterium]|nr:type II secretion system F family protein [Anaerolineales bacterium]
MGLVAAAGWFGRGALNAFAAERPASLAGLMTASAVAVLTLSLALWIEHQALRRAWRVRTAAVLGVDNLGPASIGDRLRRHLIEVESNLDRSLMRLPMVGRVVRDWQDAGLGSAAWTPVCLLAMAGWAGWIVGGRMAGPLFGLALGLSLPLAPKAWITSRAETARRRFGDQLPVVLDSLAAGLSAGLSFQQAVRYAADELQPPAGAIMQTLAHRLALGFTVEEGLAGLLETYPEESLGMVVDGINLQRRFGGDLVWLLSETAARLRERVELEQEVRAVTAQGRLSGWVLAALVPVSAGLLLASNPRYIDVLFDTWIGQALLVFSLVLQLAGWAVISRLVRVAF